MSPNFTMLKNEVETGDSRIRRTKVMVAISGQYDDKAEERVRFRRQRNGTIKLDWGGRVPVKTQETERCDLGHHHSIEKSEAWVWNYCELTRDDAERLAAFLRNEDE